MHNSDKIKHLYWRAGFGLSPEEWKTKQHYSVSKAVEALFNDAQNVKKLPGENLYRLKNEEKKGLSKEEKKKLRKQSKKLVRTQNVQWLGRMAQPDQSALLEKMSLFWHGHFACITKTPRPAYQQLMTIRTHALGSFRDLVLAISKDVSMIRFLNNQQNKKNSPNENFARELMELFTIGRGNYTEQDIKEAARAFTGWASNLQGEFKFRSRQHDYGEKVFMGQRGNFNGEDIIDIILSKQATAEYITTKIYRYFVNEKIDERRVKSLAKSFYQSDYNIEQLMRNIFTSDWFYDSKNVGVRIKSPMELTAGIMRQLEVAFKKPLTLLAVQKALGQILFKPPNVAGWAGGKSWIDNSTLLLRLNMTSYLFKAAEVSFKVKEEFEARKRNKAIKSLDANVDIQPLINLYKDRSHEEIFAEMSRYLLQTTRPVDPRLFDDYIIHSNKSDYIKSLYMRLTSLPEYQMC